MSEVRRIKKTMAAREAIAWLESEGFRHRYTEGSHAFYEKHGLKVPVPLHGRKDLGKHVIASIKRKIQEARLIDEQQRG